MTEEVNEYHLMDSQYENKHPAILGYFVKCVQMGLRI